jgi:hypothetical protein
MKIRVVEAEVFRVVGRTDMTELIVVLRFLQLKPQQDATVYQNFIIPYFK